MQRCHQRCLHAVAQQCHNPSLRVESSSKVVSWYPSLLSGMLPFCPFTVVEGSDLNGLEDSRHGVVERSGVESRRTPIRVLFGDGVSRHLKYTEVMLSRTFERPVDEPTFLFRLSVFRSYLRIAYSQEDIENALVTIGRSRYIVRTRHARNDAHILIVKCLHISRSLSSSKE